MRNTMGTTLGLCLLAVVPSELQAQTVPPLRQSAANAAATVQFAPAVTGRGAASVPVNVSFMQSTQREGTILMIVGAAGIITGLVADESVITIVGAGVAGVGLYIYLREGGDIEVDP